MSVISVAFLLAAAGAADPVAEYLVAQMQTKRIPGLAVAIVRDGAAPVVHTYGMASPEAGDPVVPETRFQIASTTKVLTGMLAMKLAEQGRLALDDALARHLTDLPETWRSITVRQLAGHASGMAPAPMPSSFEDMAAALSAARAVPLAAKPGERVAYGSFDFTVLAAVLEKAGGAPFETLLRERVLTPLGLQDAAFDHARISPDQAVRSWDLLPRRATTSRPEGGVMRAYTFHYPAYAYAAGGLFASIRDLAALLQAVDRRQFLSPAAYEQMWTPCPLSDGTGGGFGVGWTIGTVAGRRAVGHSGGPALSDLLYFPDERLGVVVLTNQGKLFPNLAQGIARLLLTPPAFLAAPGIADAFPSLTTATGTALASLAAEKPDAERFAGAAKEAVEGSDGWFAIQLSSFPPMDRLVLLADAPRDGGRERSYRSVHGRASLRWRVVTDAFGRIADFDLADE